MASNLDKTKYLVANWKMNQSLEEVNNFFKNIKSLNYSKQVETWIGPQFIHIPQLIENKKSLKFALAVGSQNSAEEKNGAFTGEVSPLSLKDMGVEFSILGHSERRNLFQESNATINKKTRTALEVGLKVILCVGESLQQRKEGKTLEVVGTQLEECLKGISAKNGNDILIAYEPVWAIGTGLNATTKEIEEVHKYIAKWCNNNAFDLPILYGGSVKPQNIKEIANTPYVSGALVGGASLKPMDFIELYNGMLSSC